MLDLEQLISPSRAARVAAVDVKTVKTWVAAGHVAHVRTDIGRLIDAASLREHVARREAASAAKRASAERAGE